MSHASVLVTGGAGYIGSHVARQLSEAGEKVLVLDNLSTGFANAVLHGELIEGDVGDKKLVSALLQKHQIKSVMHFAAHTIVPESVADPMMYYRNNTCASRNLLQCSQEASVEHFIFSSTAAVYGMPESGTAKEDTPLSPINPYGTSKMMTEWMLRDLALASKLRYISLRYFNVAGADLGGRIGQSTAKATLLIKVACEAAIGRRSHVSIFGTDYPTPDGTGIRDYIHVEDLASAHLKALDYLRKGGNSNTLNCGYGHGYSVREVLGRVQKISGVPFKIKEEPRRAGDPPALIAHADRIRQMLDWSPEYDDLDIIIKTALEWEIKRSADN